jgi:hypothetical protein
VLLSGGGHGARSALVASRHPFPGGTSRPMPTVMKAHHSTAKVRHFFRKSAYRDHFVFKSLPKERGWRLLLKPRRRC